MTKHSVEELLEAIFVDRLEDGQLDECPLTLEEIATIKSSFISTILNMLHSRIEYPEDEKPKKKGGDRGKRDVKKDSEENVENAGKSDST